MYVQNLMRFINNHPCIVSVVVQTTDFHEHLTCNLRIYLCLEIYFFSQKDFGERAPRF